jgi:hypothetical protein
MKNNYYDSAKIWQKLVLICGLCLLAGTFMNTAVAANNEPSSIDVIDQGVADTGETHFGKAEKEISASKASYKVAVLPYVDASGLEGRSREMAVNAIKDSLKKKYPQNNGRIISAKKVQQALKANPYENADAPVLAELVKLGQATGADRIIYINMLPVREKESGVMIIAGTQTKSAVVTMKLKCVDVNEEKYIFNQNVEDIGSSSSINFWKIGEASQAKAVKRATLNCMKDFLTAFD